MTTRLTEAELKTLGTDIQHWPSKYAGPAARLLAHIVSLTADLDNARTDISIAEDQAKRRTDWFEWCQQHIKGACGRYHDENAKAYILQLESELDAARRECVTGREAYSTIGCSFCLYENDRPARDAYEAARAERAKWAAFADAAGHMRDWLHECSIDQEESHTVRNEARELVAAFDAAKEAK